LLRRRRRARALLHPRPQAPATPAASSSTGAIESRSALCGDRGDPDAQIYQRKCGTDGVDLGRHARDARRPTT
jgi:hypothetical protein